MRQTYKNDGQRPLHARYVFPASTRAAVNGLSMTVGNQIVYAKIREREEARTEFAAAKKAVADGIRPEQLIAERKRIVEIFGAKRVSLEMLEAKVGRSMVEWSAFDIADLRGDWEALRSGEASVEEIFPPKTTDPNKPVDGPLTGTAISEALP